MVQNHLLRLVAPKSWPMTKRKGIRFITRPRSGPHKLIESIPLNLLLKNVLNHASTTKEVKTILNKGKVLVNNEIVKDYNYPIGIMDIISIPSTKEYYVVLIGENGKFSLNKIPKEKASLKLCKIINKTLLRKNKLQLNFLDGRNQLTNNKEYKVGDTLVLNLDKNEIKDHLEFKKGASVYLINGKHKGETAILDEIGLSKGNSPHRIKLKKGNETFETLKDYTFVVDKSIL